MKKRVTMPAEKWEAYMHKCDFCKGPSRMEGGKLYNWEIEGLPYEFCTHACAVATVHMIWTTLDDNKLTVAPWLDPNLPIRTTEPNWSLLQDRVRTEDQKVALDNLVRFDWS